MKKNNNLILALFLVAFTKPCLSQSVIFSEDFESIPLTETYGLWSAGNIPTSFKEYNEDGHTFSNSLNLSLAMGNNGCRIMDFASSGASATFAAGHNFPNNFSSDWLVSPLINLTGINNFVELRFEIDGSTSNGDLHILVSTNGNLLSSNWQNVTTYSDIQNGFYHVDLNSFVNQNINLAFKYTTTNMGDMSNSNRYVKIAAFDIISFGTANIDNSGNSSTSFNLYPNPAQQSIHISGDINEAATVNIFDLNGRELFTSQITKIDSSIDVSGLNAGIYFFEINGIRTKVSISR